MLTRKQYQLLRFINDRLSRSGVSPSFDEMKAALGLRSKSGVHRLISALEERGCIRRLPHRARALEVLRAPEEGWDDIPAPAAEPAAGEPDATSDPLAGRLTTADSPADPANDTSVPLYGRIAAGTPIEALRMSDSYVDIPPSMLARGRETYALEIAGDSMVEAGILDGDTAVIASTDKAETGDIVVALVDDQEATLKRMRKRGETVQLEPANPAFETQHYHQDRVAVQGRLIGLVRRY